VGGRVIALKRLILTIILFLLLPNSAFAYSYGDPNKEDIAEALKVIKVKLEANPPDWEGAFQQYLVHKKVLALEFGEEVTSTLEANFSVKNKGLLEVNYRGMLAMNLKRRFDYANKQIEDYAQAKLLLAKARGTFEVLTPYVADANIVSSVEASFKKALESLGNPGLFGVGKVESNPEQFKKETDFIYNAVKPLFPFRFASASGQKEETLPADKTDSEAQQTSQPGSTESKDAADSSSNADVKEQPKDTAAPLKEESKEEMKPQPAEPQSAEPTLPAPSEPKAKETKSVTQQDTNTSTEQGPKQEIETTAEQKVEVSEQKASSPTKGTDIVDSGASSTANPPLDINMETESKVNPLITVSVISFVLLLGGTAVFFGLKKGFFKF
jgi:hypothetical protein